MVKIKIVVGSTRPTRVGPKIAEWVFEQAKKESGIDYELLDVASFNLPVLDEPESALTGNYANDHTKAWSAAVKEADGFIFVTPEYNHGVPGNFKNAVDYLFAEWNHKPVSFVSYGANAGGARATEQWRAIVAQLKMHDLSDHVLITNYWENLNETGSFSPQDHHSQALAAVLKEIAFWSENLVPIRQKLSV